MKKIYCKAFAKLNLTLDCLEKRDDGYHNLKSIMHPISLFDTVTVEKNGGPCIDVECDFIDKEKNLAYKAARLFFDTLDIKDRGISIKIEKHIPLLSGLGGGSGDAAAVINLLDRLYDTGLSDGQKIDMAKKLGADVPFGLFCKTAVAEGIGEKLTFLDNFPQLSFVLIKHGEKGSTGQMYKMLDSAKKESGSFTDRVLELLSCGKKEAAIKNFGNDFSVCQPDGQLLKISEFAKNFGAITTSLTGSGPTCFSAFETETDSLNFLNAAKQTFSFVSLAKSVG